MAEPGWFEVRAVVRAPRELVDKAIAAIEGSDLVEVNHVDVVALDDDLRRWDGARPPGVVVLGQPEPNVFDLLRQGHELHEIPRPGDPTLDLLGP